MGLTVTVLGCDGSYAGPDGACSGYLVSSGDTHVWLDCGPGTLANLQRHIDLHDLSAIVVSHSHPDHWAELPVAYNALGYTADTGSAWSMSTLGAEIDMLLCEATFPEDQAGRFPHLTASEAGTAAREAGVDRLVLTHLLPGSDHDLARHNAATTFGNDVEIATTHARFEL